MPDKNRKKLLFAQLALPGGLESYSYQQRYLKPLSIDAFTVQLHALKAKEMYALSERELRPDDESERGV